MIMGMSRGSYVLLIMHLFTMQNKWQLGRQVQKRIVISISGWYTNTSYERLYTYQLAYVWVNINKKQEVFLMILKKFISRVTRLNHVEKLFLTARFLGSLYFGSSIWYGFASQAITPIQVGIYYEPISYLPFSWTTLTKRGTFLLSKQEGTRE